MWDISAVTLFIVLALSGRPVQGVVRDASDFATEVVEYVQGGTVPKDLFTKQYFNDPTTALGPPTIDTTGDGFVASPEQPVQVLPMYAAFRARELVSVGEGDWLVLKFDHPVEDDPRNPCGIDFIIFGNTVQAIDNDIYWDNGDPNAATINSIELSDEPTAVAVSQDGITWHTFIDGPYADDFAPTLGRVYDPAHPAPSLPGNQWWGEPTDPTLPINPNWGPADFVGLTIAQYARRYGCSAGGTGFDLADVGLPWIQYVKIENPVGSGQTPEIDAVADVRPLLFPDFDCDADVDHDDAVFLTGCTTGPAAGPPAPGCARADLDEDNDVDQTDFAIVQRCLSGQDNPADRECTR